MKVAIRNIKGKDAVTKGFFILVFAGIAFFFAFPFRYHIYFEEQLQIFIPDFSHFKEYFLKPAALASYAGDFLTQFYFLKGGGAAVITSCLFILWWTQVMVMKKLTTQNETWHPLSLLPVILGWISLCDPEYPVSNIISIIICLTGVWFYLSLKNSWLRLFTGLILIPVLYILAGCSFLLFLVIAAFYELILIKGKSAILNSALLLGLSAFVPYLFRKAFLLSVGQAYFYLSESENITRFLHYTPLISVFISIILIKSENKTRSRYLFYPVMSLMILILISGIRKTASFEMEKIMRLDFEARNNHWQKVLILSGKYRMRSSLATYYTNMALAKLGLMADELMNYYQPAATGLFIPVNANENYFTITMSNEVYWQLGDVNAAQHSALLGMIFSPKSENSRLMKRLVEINIVNGEYPVAEKYIAILEKTLFHRLWAKEKRKYLYNESACSSSKWISEKRKIIPSSDLLKKSNEYLTTLSMLADEHSGNRMAVDYLLCFHLLSKDVEGFSRDFRKYYAPSDALPRVYQQALLIRIASGKETLDAYAGFRFNPEEVKSMTEYMRLYEDGKSTGKLLRDKYEKSYWFYYHFATLN